jgi:hypothetical protein
MSTDKPYTCADYREEMMLLGLKKRLEADSLSEEEKASIQDRIAEIERSMGL